MGFFDEAKQKCYDQAGKFWDVARWFENKPFVSGAAPYFFTVGDLIRSIGDRFRKADLWATDVGYRLEARVKKIRLNEYILDLMVSWDLLRTDPDFWIRDIIRIACGFGPYDVQNWDFVAKSILEKYLPTLYYFWKYTLPSFKTFFDNPMRSIRYWIGEAIGLDLYHLQTWEFMIKAIFDKYFHSLYLFWYDDLDTVVNFIRDPANSIRYWIGEQIGLSPYNMQTWEFMIKTLFEKYFPTLYDFWRFGLEDPIAWFLYHLERDVRRFYERIGNLALEILAHLLGV